MIRVLLVDDQASIRDAFRIILDAQPDLSVVAEAADGAAALEQTRLVRPDVVLADIRMPRMDGLALTRALATDPTTAPIRVVVVTTFDLDEYVHEALRHGAAGFLLKRSSPALLVEAVRAAMAGDTLISPQLTVRLLRATQPVAAPTRVQLTDREREIARLVAAGHTNAEIGVQLFISPGTVKNHVAAVQHKVGARNRVGIAAWAWESGLATG